MIVVFGSINIDIVLPIEKFPNPGETILSLNDYVKIPGGKGSNQAVAAARAGAKVAIIGQVGDDSFGRISVQNLKQHEVWTSGVGMSERPTGFSTIAVNPEGKNTVITAPGANLDTTADQVPDEVLNEKNIILTELELNPDEILKVMKHAKMCEGCGAKVILNASPARNMKKEFLQYADFVLINKVEAIQIAEILGIGSKSPVEIALVLARLGKLTCIITLEEKGAIAACNDVLYKIPPLNITPVDTTGAGDCFCGVFAACLEKGFDWLKATHYASTGAGLSCLGLGAQEAMPEWDEIVARLNETPKPTRMS